MQSQTLKKTQISFIFLLFCAFNLQAQNTDQEIRQVLQLVEYVGVDYPSAVKGNQIIDVGEYQEMLEFSNIVSDKLTQFSTIDASIVSLSNALQDAVKNKAEVSVVKSLAVKLKTQLSQLTDELVLPKELLLTLRNNTAIQDDKKFSYQRILL